MPRRWLDEAGRHAFRTDPLDFLHVGSTLIRHAFGVSIPRLKHADYTTFPLAAILPQYSLAPCICVRSVHRSKQLRFTPHDTFNHPQALMTVPFSPSVVSLVNVL